MPLAWEPFVISGLFPTYDYNKRTGILSGAQRKREGESNLANQEQKSICREIGARTGGDIYIGVVGPVRSGKSTFIKRFMEQLVLPNLENTYQRDRARDELPQSGSGRTIMTTEPKFVPEQAVEADLIISAADLETDSQAETVVSETTLAAETVVSAMDFPVQAVALAAGAVTFTPISPSASMKQPLAVTR